MKNRRHPAIPSMTTRYVFEDCEVDLDRFQVSRDGRRVHVERQVFDVLVYLIDRRERVVPKAELLDNVWGDRFVSESALASRVKAARRAVGDDGSAQRIIRTAFGRGYQFVAPLTEVAGAGPAATAGVTQDGGQDIRFCQARDGARIAYAAIGTGQPLVKAANWMTHLEFERESPIWKHWIAGLSRQRALLRYDERGCGLSDWDVSSSDFDDWVEDLEVVVDSAGLDRFALLGVSQGAAVAVAFAVRHPERVERMVLYGSYARGRLARADSPELRQQAAIDVELARVGWGGDDASFRQVFSAQFLPDGTREDWDELNELLRRTTSPANAVRFLETFATVDVTAEAPQVACPTLIMHARDDHRVPWSAAREMATLIPGSRFVTLPGRNHILTEWEPAWPLFLGELDRFLA